MYRDSATRSRTPQRRYYRDSRSRRRTSGQSQHYQSQSRRRSRTPPSRDRYVAQDRSYLETNEKWNPSSSHFDTNQVYGLSFPRQVESTQWSRKFKVAGFAIADIKLVQMMTNGLQNWGLRLLANGRYVTFELFRNRTEAMLASAISKELYQQKDQIDLNKVLAHFAPNGTDPNDWNQRQDLINQLAKKIVGDFKQYMPVDQQQLMMDELERLKAENARLNQLHSGTSGGNPTPLAKAFAASPKDPKDPKDPNDAGSPLPTVPDEFDPLEQYRRPKKSRAVFGYLSPDDGSKTKINQWIKKNVPKSDQATVETLASELQKEIQDMSEGDRPNLEAVLADWGLSSQVLSKMSMDSQFRLLAAVQYVKN